MHSFRVWAPLPKKVELQFENVRHPMQSGADGWWSKDIPKANTGSNYGFVLDGEGPYPDPRSACQLSGVHGLSQLVDQNNFPWTDKNWQAPPLSSALIYELHIGTFTEEGTFDAAIKKLDHLLSLGVTHVELMPVNTFSGSRGWGYDGVDLYAPHPAYGGQDGLKRLVNACHARRLAVILDVVYNHIGPEGNYLGKFGPYFSSSHSIPWGAAINFDGSDSEEVRRFFCDNALMWLRDYHFDGLRLDAVHAIFDTSATPLLEQLSDEVKHLAQELGRPLVLLPESDLNDPRLLWPRTRGGFELDAQWSDDFHHALHSILTGEKNGYYADFGSFANLAKALRHAYVYDGQHSNHRRRRHGRSFDDLSGHRFLAYLQNHDQVGNRAKGDRTSQLLNIDRLKIGAALVLTSPFVPMVFQGEEWGASTPFQYFTDHQDPKLAQAVREGRRNEFVAFGWKAEEIPDPQAQETFKNSKLKWNEISRPSHVELLQWYQQLVRLRRMEPSLSDGNLEAVQTRFDEEKGWFVLERNPIQVIVNFNAEPQTVPLAGKKHHILLAAKPIDHIEQNEIKLPPDSVVILKGV